MITQRYTPLALFFLVAVPLSFLTHSKSFLAGNDSSRFAHIESLVDYGHSHINDSRYRNTIDRVIIDGRAYTNKPPFLNFVGAAIYSVIQKIFGFSFKQNPAPIITILIWILVVAPTAWLVVLFYQALMLHKDIPPETRLLTTIALAAGTVLTTYSVTFNNHTQAAALLFASLIAAWNARGFLAGVLIGLVTCIDILPGIIFIPITGFILYRRGEASLLRPYLGSLSIAALVFFAANWFTSGSLLTPKLTAGSVDLGSHFARSLGGVILPNRWTYPFECSLGWHGIFSVSPVLIFGAWGLVRAVKGETSFPKDISRALAAGCLLMILYHSFFTGNFGGWTYGFRYTIPIIPILLFFVPVVLSGENKRIFQALLAVSILFSLIGTYNPWPPQYEIGQNPTQTASNIRNPIGANATAWMREHLGPDSFLAAFFGEIFIHKDPLIRNKYLQIFYQSKQNLEMVEEIREESGRHYLKRGHSLAEGGQYKQAIGAFRQFLTIDPNNGDVYQTLSNLHRRLGEEFHADTTLALSKIFLQNESEGFSLLESISQRVSGDQRLEVLNLTAQVAYNADRKDIALTAWTSALSLNPNQPAALLNLVKLFEKDQPLKAAKYLRRYLSLIRTQPTQQEQVLRWEQRLRDLEKN